jgi:hypothetical protein
MTKTLRTMTTTLGLAVIAAALAPIAALGCDSMPGTPPAASPGSQAPYLIQAAYRPAQSVLASDGGASNTSIVGMWAVNFVAENNPAGPPNGTLVDWGYVQWHSDGTEIMNSGGHEGAFCMGVWAQTGPSAYKVNHYALPFDATTGLLTNYVRLHEQVTVDSTGNHYFGTFTIDLYSPGAPDLRELIDPSGPPVASVTGIISAQRITAYE